MALGSGIIYGAGLAALIVGGIAAASTKAKAATGGGGSGSGGGGSGIPVKHYVVQAGDSMTSIAKRCTGNEHRYSELLAVNPTKPVGYQYHDLKAGTWPIFDLSPDQAGFDPTVMQFVGKVFKTLNVGETINVPADWGCP